MEALMDERDSDPGVTGTAASLMPLIDAAT